MGVKINFGSKDDGFCKDEGCPAYGTEHAHLSDDTGSMLDTLLKEQGYTGTPIPMETKTVQLKSSINFEPAGQPHVVDANNWHQFALSWEVEEVWWASFVQTYSVQTVIDVLDEYAHSAEPSFALFCTNVLPELIEQNGPYKVPANLITVEQAGMESVTTLKVGVLTVMFNEGIAQMLKKQAAKGG